MWRLSARVLGPGQAGPELKHQRLVLVLVTLPGTMRGHLALLTRGGG